MTVAWSPSMNLWTMNWNSWWVMARTQRRLSSPPVGAGNGPLFLAISGLGRPRLGRIAGIILVAPRLVELFQRRDRLGLGGQDGLERAALEDGVALAAAAGDRVLGG